MKPYLICYLLFSLSSIAFAAGSMFMEQGMILNEGFIAPRAGQMNPKPGSTRPKGSNEHPKGGLLGVAANGKFQLQIYAKCAQKDKDTIIQAWEDSKQFSDALGLWKPKGDYQLAVSTYMGARSTSEDLRGSDFPKQIRNTISRLQGLHEGKSTQGNAYLWVYCNEDSFWYKNCKHTGTSAVVAYEWEANLVHNWYMTFCPPFFDPKWSVPLKEMEQSMDTGRYEKGDIDNYDNPIVQAGTFFHETCHMSQLVTSPQAKDIVYGPKLVYDLARTRNTDAAVYNADSWWVTALAIWAQVKYKLKTPPLPREYLKRGKKSMKLSKRSGSQKHKGGGGGGGGGGSIVHTGAKNIVPHGAKPVAKGEPFSVNPKFWEVYKPKGDSLPQTQRGAAPQKH